MDVFQGEPGPEGLRGLPGEGGNKGTKVIILLLLQVFVMHPELKLIFSKCV